MIVDQVFRYYEPEKTKSTSIVPNFIELMGASSGRGVKALSQCYISSSNKNIEVKASDSNELSATVQNGRSLTSQRGYIFVFSDELRTKLLGACKIEI